MQLFKDFMEKALCFLTFMLLVIDSWSHYLSGPVEVGCEREEFDLDTYCLLNNLRLMRNQKVFTVREDDKPDTITDLEISSTSSVPVLTTNLCEVFPNLETLVIDTFRSHKLDEIEEDTFVQCSKLKKFHLRANSLRTLENNIFNRNLALIEISISDNRVETLPETLFHNLENLRWLFLNRNQLKQIPVEAFKDLKKVEWLDLHGNQLIDLNIEQLLPYLPKLERINLRDNDFECVRLAAIMDALKASSVDLDNEIPPEMTQPRYRNYHVTTVNEIECLTEEDYQREVIQESRSRRNEGPRIYG